MELSCNKCNHEWITRTEKKPKVCPSCKSKSWMKGKKASEKSVYVVSFDNGTTKIGISNKVGERIKKLSSEYGCCVESLYNTISMDTDAAKDIEQYVLFVLREYMVNGTELLMIDFESVKQEVLTAHKNKKKTVTDILSSGDEYLPITPLIRIINGERYAKGGCPFNLNAWISCCDNQVFIEVVKTKYGDAIIKKQGGYSYAHKFVFADIGISAGGNVKMEILEYLAATMHKQ